MDEPAVTLVYHPVRNGSATTCPSSAFADAARRVLGSSPGSEVCLVSPYLSANVLEKLVKGRPFRLITDVTACFERDATERLTGFLCDNLPSVRNVHDVHAKVVLVEHAALVGSANLTGRGFAHRDEMACLVRGAAAIADLRDWFEQLWCAGQQLDRQRVTQAADFGRAWAAARRAAAVSPPAQPAGTSRPPPFRSLGWMKRGLPADSSGVAPGAQSVPDDAEALELIAQLRALVRSRGDAELVLDLLARALDVAGLPPDDPRLHLNFGKRPLSITVNQRYVAWCCPDRGVNQFGLILDDTEIATAACRQLVGAWSGRFRRRGADDLPTIHVPLTQLPAIPESLLASWRRAIRHEVDRPTASGAPRKSSYKKHTRVYLHAVLKDGELRRSVVDRAFARRCWWFGVNNGTNGHVSLDQIRPLLDGAEARFAWPVGHSKPKKLYREMRAGDEVLLWTGHSERAQSEVNWGLVGRADIGLVERDHVVLQNGRRLARPITPYPRNHPTETAEVRFLRTTFGDQFTPLGDVLRAVFGTPRTPPITVFPVPDQAFEAVVEASGDGSERRAP